jgi:choline-glycine betaine transporter
VGSFLIYKEHHLEKRIELLYGGGKHALTALQAGTVITGIPFTVVLILISIGLFKGLRASLKEDQNRKNLTEKTD